MLHPLQTLRPLEDKFLFSQFQAPPLDDADFSAKPMIMVIGQYSVGELALYLNDFNLTHLKLNKSIIHR